MLLINAQNKDKPVGEFDQKIPENLLNIVDKKRTNLLTWRGQFSPQLIEVLLDAYCLPDSVVLDPFSGSGTVLLEAGRLHREAYGCEINPAAWILSQTYELINEKSRHFLLNQVQQKIDQYFPFILFKTHAIDSVELQKIIPEIKHELIEVNSQVIFNTLIILLNLSEQPITPEQIQSHFAKLRHLIETLPYSDKPIKSYLRDARQLPFSDNKIDFVITSPPYINVFNYHQNYRKSAEILGWNLLKICRSEIGSNRANRGNRFYTVIQYCLDLADVLIELSRVSKKDARIILIVGHQSQVLGVPFYNSDILEKIATRSGMYQIVLRQERQYKNKFGKMIQEDILNFYNLKIQINTEMIYDQVREIAWEALNQGIACVSPKNLESLQIAMSKIEYLQGSPQLLETS